MSIIYRNFSTKSTPICKHFVNISLIFKKRPGNPGTKSRFGAIYGRCFFINNNSYAIFPLFLISDAKYQQLTSTEKILYTLLLNRKNFSKKNLGNFSDKGGIFIYYSNIQLQMHLNCSERTITKSLNNLEQAGLIRKEYQKRGLPLKIYVNDVFGMHGKSNIQEKEITYKPKQNFKPHSPAIPQNKVSFDIDKAEEVARKNRADFGSKKNKRRSVNSTF